jgi:hypothetical protein
MSAEMSDLRGDPAPGSASLRGLTLVVRNELQGDVGLRPGDRGPRDARIKVDQ